MTDRRRFCAAALGVLCLIAPGLPVRAADAPASAPALSADDKALVQKAVDYVDGLKAVQGRFRQIDPRGHASAGLFYMQRPGKARFQYDPPAALLVVADGETVSVYDRKLKSFDQYPLAQTPLALLLSKPFRLDRGAAVLSVEHGKDSFAVALGDARKRVQGRLTLAFSQTPIALRGWTLIDAQGQRTEVKLDGLKLKDSLSPDLFVLHNPAAHAAGARGARQPQAN